MTDVSRRKMLTTLGFAGAVVLPGALAASTESAAADPVQNVYLFFTADEAAFVEAATDRLIPRDEQWGGANDAGVASYIDKQLAGAWGAGERLYRSGPWQAGVPSQGYQLPFTPSELFRAALGAINSQLSQAGTPFSKMSADDQDKFLRTLESGSQNYGGVPAAVFFQHLWEATLEGFFADPVYGGNRNMLSWRMIGFPGAYASYYDVVDKHGIKIDREPMSLADDVHGHMHMNPGIPARLP
jgi:gluconate 2-dehydrogenase gamma chain